MRALSPLPILLALHIAIAPLAFADQFPSDAGVLNVRNFGATGNGQTDDTKAFLQAMTASGEDSGTSFWQDRIIFVPNGIYRVSSSLQKRYQNGKFGSGLILLGESQARTIIRLDDHAAGFDDPTHPRAVLFTSSKLFDGSATSGGKDYIGLGEGNDAYMNFVENLTIDVGDGNKGAIALDYLGNNIGAIRDVTLKAGVDSGAIGLAMTRKWPGPTYVRDLLVQGFGVGIAAAQTEYGLTFEHIKLIGQRSAAIRNDQNALTFRDVEIGGTKLAIVNGGGKSFMAIENSRTEGVDLESTIRNDGVIVLRNLMVGGQSFSGTLNGSSQWVAAAPPDWLPALADPPIDPGIAPEQWTNPARFGATGDPTQDATDALRRAMATGAPVLYLPHGTYVIREPIDIPSTLRRIAGMNSTIKVSVQRSPSFARTSGMMRVGSAGQPLLIERLAFDNSNQGDQLALELSGSRDLIIRDVVSAGVTLLDRTAAGGRAFLEDVCCGRMRLAGPQPVFARQLDTEGGGVRIKNDGSPLAILGLKTEGVSTIIENDRGAHTDLFGGLVYVVRDGAGAGVPAFRDDASWLSASFVEESLRPASRYEIYVSRDPADDRGAIPVSDFPARGFGRTVPWLIDNPQ